MQAGFGQAGRCREELRFRLSQLEVPSCSLFPSGTSWLLQPQPRESLSGTRMKTWNLVQKLHNRSFSSASSVSAEPFCSLCFAGEVMCLSSVPSWWSVGAQNPGHRVCALSLYPFPGGRVLCRMAEGEQGVWNKKLILHFSRIWCTEAVPSE